MKQARIPHIVGLRGVAVLLVILFHLGVPLFTGGYVGVDVFFVISGFLITGLISREVGLTGSFDFGAFYLRRARRILPTLFATLFFALIVGFLLLAPPDLQSLGDTTWRAALAIVNVQFWRESGYFDVSAGLKPLLHTWSLSIEEQFYLLWPLILLLALRARKIIPTFLIFLLLFLASYGLLLVFQGGGPAFMVSLLPALSDGPSTVFYLVPFRVFEFLTGAMTFLIYERTPRFKSGAMAFAGLLMVLVPSLCLSASTPGSAAYGLVPCIGAAILIYSGSSPWMSWLLGQGFLAATGEISYSLYLVHWPVIVFLAYYTGSPITWPLRGLALVVTVGLSVLMNRWVEEPFRYGVRRRALGSNRAFVVACIGFALGFFVIGEGINRQKGWPWRLSAQQQALARELADPKKFHLDHFGGALHGANGYFDPVDREHVDFVLIGDSHAEQYTQGLYDTLYRKDGAGVYVCHFGQIFLPGFRNSEQDDRFHEQFLALYDGVIRIGREHPDAVFILAQSWAGQLERASFRADASGPYARIGYDRAGMLLALSGIRKFKDALGSRHKLIVLGNVPGVPNGNGPLFTLLRPEFIPHPRYGKSAYANEQAHGYEINRLFEVELPKLDGVIYLDPYDVLARDGRPILLVNNAILYSDASHLSIEGSDLVANYFEKEMLNSLPESRRRSLASSRTQ
jgi:peptidoglycan/LPS O-acetylase OafA/YrhL